MVVNEQDELAPCHVAYDSKVVGVVSGAGEYKPALMLDAKRKVGGVPIALIGKVYCKVDATSVPIRAGDLLTTSNRAGHAIKAEASRCLGTVLGKALRPLSRAAAV
jgi:hypothetical protein